MHKKSLDTGLCPRFQYAVELIGRRWNGAILFLLQNGSTRFGELRDGIPGITDPMLSARLRELETEGVLTRTVHDGAPVRIEYALSEKGQALSRVFSAIGDWSHDWVEPGRVPSHESDAGRRSPRRPAGARASRAAKSR